MRAQSVFAQHIFCTLVQGTFLCFHTLNCSQKQETPVDRIYSLTNVKSRFLARAHARAPRKIVIFAFTTFTLFVVIHQETMRYKRFICIHLEIREERAKNQGKWGEIGGIGTTGGKEQILGRKQENRRVIHSTRRYLRKRRRFLQKCRSFQEKCERFQGDKSLKQKGKGRQRTERV